MVSKIYFSAPVAITSPHEINETLFSARSIIPQKLYDFFPFAAGLITDPTLVAKNQTFRLAAEVGLLTHNIKVRGSPTRYQDGLGCRVLIGQRGEEKVAYAGR